MKCEMKVYFTGEVFPVSIVIISHQVDPVHMLLDALILIRHVRLVWVRPGSDGQEVALRIKCLSQFAEERCEVLLVLGRLIIITGRCLDHAGVTYYLFKMPHKCHIFLVCLVEAKEH